MVMIQQTSISFDNLGIAPKLLDILQKQKFTSPTPIQQQSIPHAITGKDLMGIAQTGTGKTLAFGIPMIQRLAQSEGKGRGLVVLPTRELALQVNDSLKKIGGSLGLKTAILIGGEPIARQLRALKMNPHIVIATPGRLIDHLEQKTINLAKVQVLVLDEADRMLDMGFAPQIKKILEQVPKERQTMLFSATMPDAIVKIANSYMSMPLRVEVAPAGQAAKSVTQEIFFVDKKDKPSLLKSLLGQYKGSILVFSRTKFAAKKIAADIRKFGETSAEIHSNRSLNQRLEALNGFKLGKYRVLVATDIAARGIDVTGIQLVVNYDLPDQAEDYVHRIGRTGRANMTGHAISFATHDQRRDVSTIERLIRKTLPVSKTPALPKVEQSESAPREFDRPARQPHKPSRPARSFDRTARSPRPTHSSDRPARAAYSPARDSDRKDQPSFDHKRRKNFKKPTDGRTSGRHKKNPFQKNITDFKWGKF
jgi:ATP-dependent RNA helicase RhlE